MSRDDLEADITLDGPELVAGGHATLRFRTTAREPVKVRGAHASFVGYEETKAVYTTTTISGSPPKSTIAVHTALERTVLIEKCKTFMGRARAGFFRNLADGALTLLGGGAHNELSKGSHDVLLEVDLPVDLAETFCAEKVRVVYEAQIHFDIPAGRDFRHTVTFAVPPASLGGDVDSKPLTIRYPENSGRGFFDTVFGPDVSLRVELPSSVVQRGGSLGGELEILFPDKPAKVEAVVCQLIRRESSTAQGHKDRHKKMIVAERLPQRPGTAHLVVPFELRLPDAMIPTCHGAKFAIVHELAISLDVPWAKDPTIRIPVVVV